MVDPEKNENKIEIFWKAQKDTQNQPETQKMDKNWGLGWVGNGAY